MARVEPVVLHRFVVIVLVGSDERTGGSACGCCWVNCCRAAAMMRKKLGVLEVAFRRHPVSNT